MAIRLDSAAAFRSLARVVETFPDDASAPLAAYKLGNYYRRAGQDELANKWFARVAASPDGVLTEEALCEQFRTAPNETEARRHAQDYLIKFPNGRCKAHAQQLISGEPSDDKDDDPPSTPESEHKGESTPG